MKQAYWDKISTDYESEIFDVFSNDKKHRILSLIRKHGKSKLTAGDIGCGTGRFLPSLSQYFGKVMAIDISPRLIKRAQADHKALANISYIRKDLASPHTRLPGIDFALSVNAFLDPSVTRRNNMFDNVCSHINCGGYFLLVVPSFESKFLTDQMHIEWNLRNGYKGQAAVSSGSDKRNQIAHQGLQQGIVLIDGVSTKHYLKEELVLILGKRGLKIKKISKIEYPWSIEFSSPPDWMKDPFPWDWLVLAEKINGSFHSV
jgi:SAM-dependent methyltransferase